MHLTNWVKVSKLNQKSWARSSATSTSATWKSTTMKPQRSLMTLEKSSTLKRQSPRWDKRSHKLKRSRLLSTHSSQGPLIMMINPQSQLTTHHQLCHQGGHMPTLMNWNVTLSWENKSEMVRRNLTSHPAWHKTKISKPLKVSLQKQHLNMRRMPKMQRSNLKVIKVIKVRKCLIIMSKSLWSKTNLSPERIRWLKRRNYPQPHQIQKHYGKVTPAWNLEWSLKIQT